VTVLAVVIGVVIGVAGARTVVEPRLKAPPTALIRINHRGLRVPAVLGEAVVMGALLALGTLAIAGSAGWDPAPGPRMAGAVALLIVVMGAAGAWDDHRGDERPRGFRGHLGALRSFRLTGGLVKLMAGGIVGLAAGALVTGTDMLATVEIGLIVAFMANLINLMDRAPGRAGKVSLAAWAFVAFLAPTGYVVASCGLVAALLAVLWDDLAERGMLGDCGANPIGAVIGLGLALSFDRPGRWVTILLLLALNLASEKWSFSAAIARTPWLRAIDSWGRTSS
jgi:UDP-GlcNAc:undecaprenyl-phosphate/decaprenyl-phosphate GlcNAc-1-phosphate transferase